MTNEKITVKLTGEDGNIFNLMGITKRALVKAGQRDKGNEVVAKVIREAKDYEHALLILMEYVNVE